MSDRLNNRVRFVLLHYEVIVITRNIQTKYVCNRDWHPPMCVYHDVCFSLKHYCQQH